ncbi:MAG: ATP-binding cassette domain-containing protein [Burkholderiaceae bacterium]
MTALVVDDVSHAFGPLEVLSRVSLRVAAGEIVALIGPSGCGKSTLLNLSAGLLHLQSGRIDAPFPSQACMFQRPRLLPWKTARANIGIGLAAAGMARAERDARAGQLAGRLGLNARDLDCFPHQLSGGMQSRVALARALVIDPALLLLDEPFSALDIGLKEELYTLLLEHLAERSPATLVVTHDLSEALRLSHRILVMAPEPGRIVGHFEIERPRARRDADWVYRNLVALQADPAVRQAFGLPEARPAEPWAAAEATDEARAISPAPASSIRALPTPAATGSALSGPRC